MGRVAVFGSGSWGTAFSVILADAGSEVALWGRRAELTEAINAKHENPDYLPGIELPRTIAATADAEGAASPPGLRCSRKTWSSSACPKV